MKHFPIRHLRHTPEPSAFLWPAGVRRVTVAGTSGAGKTTLAAKIAREIGVPHVEMDALFHGPGWVRREAFMDDVHAFIARDGWVCEWQYSDARPLILDAADVVVCLDLPRWRVMYQVVRRTISRRLRKVELWNGNTEDPLLTVFTDDEHIVRWAWNSYARTRTRMQEIATTHPHLPVIWLTSHREADALLAAILESTNTKEP